MRYFIGTVFVLITQSVFGQDVPPPMPPTFIPAQAAFPNPAILPPQAPITIQWGSAQSPVPIHTMPLTYYAQPTSGPYGSGNAKLIDYLASDYMRKQVDFSDDQNNEFVRLRKEYRKAIQSLPQQYPELYKKDLPKENRKVLIKKLQDEQEKLRKKFSTETEDILVPHQVNMIKSMQFNQSVRRLGFTQTITNSPFDGDFDTTEKQKKELMKIRVDAQKAIQKKIMEMQKETEKMRADAKAKMLKVLTVEQKKLLIELEGETDSKKQNGQTRL